MTSEAMDLIELLKEIFGSEDKEEKEDPELTESSELIELMKEVFREEGTKE